MKLSTIVRFGIGALAVLVGIAAPIRAERIYGMTAATTLSSAPGVNLVYFDSATPGTVTVVGPFTGVVAGQGLRTIDFKSGTPTLYALSTSTTAGNGAAQLYTVNLNTGALTPVGSGLTLTGILGSVSVAMDYDPVNNILRVIGRGGQNWRINPTTGLLIAQDADTFFNPGDPQDDGATFPDILGIAYSNNVAGAASSTLYAWDYNADALETVGSPGGSPTSPNTGTVFTVPGTVGPPFYTLNAGADIDISGNAAFAYAVVDDGATGNTMRLLQRNLSTGAVTVVGAFPAASLVTDISVLRAITAADVTLSGHIYASRDGKGLVDAFVSATDQSGRVYSTTTGARGAFAIEGLEGGKTYIIRVRSRRYNYADQVVTLNDSLTSFDIYPGQ